MREFGDRVVGRKLPAVTGRAARRQLHPHGAALTRRDRVDPRPARVHAEPAGLADRLLHPSKISRCSRATYRDRLAGDSRRPRGAPGRARVRRPSRIRRRTTASVIARLPFMSTAPRPTRSRPAPHRRTAAPPSRRRRLTPRQGARGSGSGMGRVSAGNAREHARPAGRRLDDRGLHTGLVQQPGDVLRRKPLRTRHPRPGWSCRTGSDPQMRPTSPPIPPSSSSRRCRPSRPRRPSHPRRPSCPSCPSPLVSLILPCATSPPWPFVALALAPCPRALPSCPLPSCPLPSRLAFAPCLRAPRARAPRARAFVFLVPLRASCFCGALSFAGPCHSSGPCSSARLRRQLRAVRCCGWSVRGVPRWSSCLLRVRVLRSAARHRRTGVVARSWWGGRRAGLGRCVVVWGRLEPLW